MIRFDNVSFRYEGMSADVYALRELSLMVRPGEMLAVLGSNGSGKSTLARLCNGLLVPSSGSVTIDGVDTHDERAIFSARERIGVVFQSPDDQIVATSVEDDVAFGPENLGLSRDEIRNRVDEALACVELTELAQREPHLLSGGQKQRLAIAGALAMRPAYLVLDEPTSMIDSRGRVEVMKAVEAVRRTGSSVLLITHSVAEASAADHVLVLAAGEKVFYGSPRELFLRGDEFGDWGLELPPLGVLVQALSDRGFLAHTPTLEPLAVLEALCL